MDTEIRVTSCAGLGWIALWVFFILMSLPSRGQFYQLQTNLKDLVEVQRSILEEMKSQIPVQGEKDESDVAPAESS